MYSIINGDTFSSISRKEYGTEVNAGRIAAANPGVVEPLSPGTTLTIPVLPSAPKDVPQDGGAADEDEVALLLGGLRFRFWEKVVITKSIDNMDTVLFGAPFDADSPEARESFRPFSYKPVEITVGGAPFFKGTMVSVDPVLEENKRTITVGCYSLPGVLSDCTAPASSFPLEFNDQGLREIAKTLAAPFGINVIFDASQGAVFERVALEPGKTVLSFLIDLAKQRNLVITSDPSGSLVFIQSIVDGVPVAKLEQGASPVVSVSPVFDPQGYYSHITGIEPVIVGLKGSQHTVKNTKVSGVVRPFTFKAPDTIDSNLPEAVSAKVGRMFGQMASYSVFVSTWRDPSGKLWEPNTIVTLQAKNAMIYSEYKFVIRSVEFTRDNLSKTAVLNLVIPGAYSGKIPERLPWEE